MWPLLTTQHMLEQNVATVELVTLPLDCVNARMGLTALPANAVRAPAVAEFTPQNTSQNVVMVTSGVP